jgi:hypothetical protein
LERREQAYVICSVAVDLKVSNLVEPAQCYGKRPFAGKYYWIIPGFLMFRCAQTGALGLIHNSGGKGLQ